MFFIYASYKYFWCCFFYTICTIFFYFCFIYFFIFNLFLLFYQCFINLWEVTTFSWYFQIIYNIFLFSIKVLQFSSAFLWFRYCLSYTPLTPLIEKWSDNREIRLYDLSIIHLNRAPILSDNIKYKKKILNHQMWITLFLGIKNPATT